jgi:hypothetical protein
MDGRLTGLGTESLVAVACVRPFNCGRRRGGQFSWLGGCGQPQAKKKQSTRPSFPRVRCGGFSVASRSSRNTDTWELCERTLSRARNGMPPFLPPPLPRSPPRPPKPPLPPRPPLSPSRLLMVFVLFTLRFRFACERYLPTGPPPATLRRRALPVYSILLSTPSCVLDPVLYIASKLSSVWSKLQPPGHCDETPHHRKNKTNEKFAHRLTG